MYCFSATCKLNIYWSSKKESIKWSGRKFQLCIQAEISVWANSKSLYKTVLEVLMKKVKDATIELHLKRLKSTAGAYGPLVTAEKRFHLYFMTTSVDSRSVILNWNLVLSRVKDNQNINYRCIKGFDFYSYLADTLSMNRTSNRPLPVFLLTKAPTWGSGWQTTVICVKLSTRASSFFLYVCSLQRNAGKVYIEAKKLSKHSNAYRLWLLFQSYILKSLFFQKRRLWPVSSLRLQFIKGYLRGF